MKNIFNALLPWILEMDSNILCGTFVAPPPTCLEDLISDGEAGAVGLVVRHEFDEELVSRGDDRRGGDLPAVLPHQLAALVHAVSHLHVVVPGQTGQGSGVRHTPPALAHVYIVLWRVLIPRAGQPVVEVMAWS